MATSSAGGWGTSSTVEVLVDGRPSARRRTAAERDSTAKSGNGSRVVYGDWSATTIAFINRDPRSDNTNGLDNVSLASTARQRRLRADTCREEEDEPVCRDRGDGWRDVAVKQASGSANATEQQVLNTMNNVAAASGDGGTYRWVAAHPRHRRLTAPRRRRPWPPAQARAAGLLPPRGPRP